ncbi:Bacterial transcription activator, effector binding domain [compost metagenome]
MDDSICEGTLSGGKYASFTIKHTAEDIQKAWTGLFPALHNGGYQIDNNKPVLERYTVQMINHHLCEFCVPIQSDI